MKDWKFSKDIANSIVKNRKDIKKTNCIFDTITVLCVAGIITASVFSFLSWGLVAGLIATVCEALGGLVVWLVGITLLALPSEKKDEKFKNLLKDFLRHDFFSEKINENSLKKAIVKEEETVKKESIAGLEEKITLTSIFVTDAMNQPIHLCQGESTYQLEQEIPCYTVENDQAKTEDGIDEIAAENRFHYFLLENNETIEDVKKYYLERKN